MTTLLVWLAWLAFGLGHGVHELRTLRAFRRVAGRPEIPVRGYAMAALVAMVAGPLNVAIDWDPATQRFTVFGRRLP